MAEPQPTILHDHMRPTSFTLRYVTCLIHTVDSTMSSSSYIQQYSLGRAAETISEMLRSRTIYWFGGGQFEDWLETTWRLAWVTLWSWMMMIDRTKKSMRTWSKYDSSIYIHPSLTLQKPYPVQLTWAESRGYPWSPQPGRTKIGPPHSFFIQNPTIRYDTKNHFDTPLYHK